MAFSLVAILFLFSLTAALVRVPMETDTFFSVTMATIWFINSESSRVTSKSLSDTIKHLYVAMSHVQIPKEGPPPNCYHGDVVGCKSINLKLISKG